MLKVSPGKKKKKKKRKTLFFKETKFYEGRKKGRIFSGKNQRIFYC
jgi:hypothetical protein